jgi:hypothetical protein
MREYLAVARVVDVRGVLIERGHRGDHGRDHRHRVRIMMKALEEAQELLVEHRMACDRGFEGVQLALARQIAVDQEVCNFQETRFRRQLLNRVPAIQEHAGVTVDIGNLAFGAGRGHEARIVGEHSEILSQMRDIENVGANRPTPCNQVRRVAGGAILQLVSDACVHFTGIPRDLRRLITQRSHDFLHSNAEITDRGAVSGPRAGRGAAHHLCVPRSELAPATAQCLV